jgi:uncharacterized membrane protein YfcA
MIDMLTVLAISILAGFLGALTGLGGGSIMTPILVEFGVPVKYAIAASMVTIIATSSGSAASYVKQSRGAHYKCEGRLSHRSTGGFAECVL